ncbi:DUF378 domain-containing protein [Candidatus Pacearchaeota archaeon]|nr:DUF378 domain-containing protein [Candidatus Pacearchaeota archaeon]
MARSVLDWIALILVIIGGLNWGLIAISDSLNLVALIFGVGVLAQIVYGLVGLGALYTIYLLFKE